MRVEGALSGGAYLCAALLLLLYGSGSVANPHGPQVAHGTAEFARPDSRTLNITNSPNAIINWQGFSIGVKETTRFLQQSGASAVLNRVVGQNPSDILGRLLSNGRVFLINPNGIIFGPDAVVDTAGLIASTLNISDEDFLAGRYRFRGAPEAGAVHNQGFIRAGKGGEVVLVAPSVENSGIIQTDGGELILAAGRQVTLTSLDLNGVQFEVQAPGDEAVNLGQLLAERGAAGVFGHSIRHEGVIEARGVARDAQGRVVLTAESKAELAAGSRIDASGPQGGSIRVESRGGAATVAGELRALGTEGQGGAVQVLGEQVALAGEARVDVSGASGGGAALIGGDDRGRGEVKTAERTSVGRDATVRADAGQAGDGGKVVVWADGAARVHGRISARGGPEGGDGGFVETSGAKSLEVTTVPDLGAPAGEGGTWFIDPNDIDIVAGSGSVNINAADPFVSTDDGAELGVDLITTALSGGASVTVTTGTGGTNAEDGDIALLAELDIDNTAGENTLTLEAANDINIDAPIFDSIPGGQTLNLVLTADSDDDGTGGTTFNADVSLGPGDLTTGSAFARVAGSATVTVDGGTWTNDADVLEIGAGSAGTVIVQNGGQLVSSAGVAVGTGAGNGILTVQGGGTVEVTSDGFDNLVIAREAGSMGTVTVSGAGSRLTTIGTDNTVQVGRRGTGTLTIEAGGVLETLDLEIGREGDGTGKVTGANSQIVVSNDDGNFSGDFANEAGFVRVGGITAGAMGTLEVLNGALVEIRNTTAEGGAGLQIARNKGSFGQVVIDGAGSLIDIASPADPDPNIGPAFLQVGRRGEGQLKIRKGGALELTGEGAIVQVSRAGDDPFAALPFGEKDLSPVDVPSTLDILSGGKLIVDGTAGGFPRVEIGQEANADGLVRVSDPGSELVTKGPDNAVRVGNRGTGELRVENGGRVDTLFFEVARFGTGTAVVDGTDGSGNPSSVIVSNDNGNFTGDFANEAGFARVAREDGSDGTLQVLKGALFQVRNSTDAEFGPEFQIARNWGSVGELLVDGSDGSGNPSTFEILQTSPANFSQPDQIFPGPGFQAGRRGKATMTVSKGAQVRLEGPEAFFVLSRAGTGGVEQDPNLDETVTVRSTLDVETGGRLVLDGTNAGMVIGRASDADGLATISGMDSELQILGAGSGRGLAVGDQGMGELVVAGGATVRIESDGFNNLDIGRQATGTGTVTVTGAGSTLTTAGDDNTVQVGRRGTGTLTVEAGGLLATLDLEVGRQGEGTATVSGAGSEVVVSNDDGNFSGDFANEAGFVRVGGIRAGASGTLEVLDGALVEVRNTTTEGGAGLQIARNKGSSGRVVIDGAGSRVDIASPADPDPNIGPAFLQVGRRGEGQLEIRKGGALELTGERAIVQVSRAGDDPFAEFFFGEKDPSPVDVQSTLEVLSGGELFVEGAGAEMVIGQASDADGVATVSGAGSAITIEGSTLVVGDDGPGVLRIENDGEVTVTGADAEVAVSRGDAGGSTPAPSLLEIMSAGTLNIDGPNATVMVGQESPSNGALTVDGAGSELHIVGDLGRLVVGADGTANLGITDGGQVVLENPDGQAGAFIAANPGSTGTATVAGAGSALDAGSQLAIGLDFALDPGGTGTLVLGDGAKLTADTVLNAGTITSSGSATLDPIFENRAGGAVSVLDGVLTIDGGGGATHTNAGLINLLGGDVIVESSAAFTNTAGRVTIPAGRTFTQDRGVFRLLGGVVQGEGDLALEGGATLEIGGAGMLDLPATVPEVAVTAGNRFEVTRRFTNTGRTRVDPEAELVLLGGTYEAGGEVEVGGVLEWSTGSLAGSGEVTVRPGGVFRTTGGGTKSLGRRFSNQGTVEVEGSSLVLLDGGSHASSFVVAAGRTLTFAGGTHTVTGSASFTGGGTTVWSGADWDGAGDITIANTMRWTAGAIGGGGDVSVASDGRLDITGEGAKALSRTLRNAGTLSLDGASVSGGASVINETGGLLTGVGTLAADLDNAGGEFAPGGSPGTMVIDGDYTQGPQGVLTVELGPASHDVVEVTGTATLDGTLNVLRFGGFVGQAGETFDIMTYAGVEGDFATLNPPPMLGLSGEPLPTRYQLEIIGATTSQTTQKLATDATNEVLNVSRQSEAAVVTGSEEEAEEAEEAEKEEEAEVAEAEAEAAETEEEEIPMCGA